MITNEDLFRMGDYESLYAQNIAFMYKLIKRFENLHIEQDELLGAGNLAFMKAVKTYNPTTARWLTYFSRLMINEILMMWRRTQKHTRCISLETVIVAIDGNADITLSDQISSDECLEEDVLDQVIAQQIMQLTRALPTKEQEVLRLHLLGTRQVDIGKKLGLSQAHISRSIKKITSELSRQYERGNAYA